MKIVRKTSPAGLVIFVAFAVGAATIGSPTPALPGGTPPTPATLQLIQFRGLVTVPIRIGASQALNFVIDSGSEHTTLNDAGLVEELNLHTRQGGVGRGMGGARLPILIAPDLAIRAGDFELFRTDLAIHHLDSLLDNDAGPRLHGLLGSALFERYVVDINPALGTVSCHDPETFSYDGPGHVVPLIMDHRRAFVRAKVTTVKGKTVKLRLMVDTGSENHLVLILGSHRHVKVPEHHMKVKALGIGGEVDAFVGPVGGLEIGSLARGRTPASFFHPTSMPAAQSIKNFDGLVGNGLLGQFRTILDYHREILILEVL